MSLNGFNNNFQQTGMPNNIMATSAGNYNNQNITMQPINSSPINIGFVRGKMGVSTFPIMSSNTTVYLFDVLDQSKFYVKATDAFGMALPIREFEYHEIIQQQNTSDIFPQNNINNVNNDDTHNNVVTKEEFEELKAQLATLIQCTQNNNKQQYNKPRKEKAENV